jgi:hypothetical protein
VAGSHLTRIVVAGVPRAGKSTLAAYLAQGAPVVATDDYLGLGHDRLPDGVAARLDGCAEWVLEGCQAGRVLRRYPHLAEGAIVYYLARPVLMLTPGQRRQAKGIATVWERTQGALRASDVVPDTICRQVVASAYAWSLTPIPEHK